MAQVAETERRATLDLGRVAAPLPIDRPAPFWSWNEVLEPDELRRQVRELARGGLGGAFMHVRVGLLTPYMGPAFMEAMAASLDEARALGLHMYLYDEDRWPSGWGDGAVPLRDPSFRVKWLLRVPAGEAPPANGDISLLAEGPGGERYYRYVSPLGLAWFNGTTYADLMDRRAMQTFLEVAYEPYAARFGVEFGGLIPAIFTDEPAVTFLPAYANIPRGLLFWTDDLPARFRALHGYDLLPRLAELFEDVGDYAATRTDYYRTCALLFEEHYSAQLGGWCRAHGIALTGHYMLEGSLAGALAWDVCILPHYRHMDWPGIDHLGRQVQEVITGLGCRSAVNQYGKARMMSELYGCAGQHLSFEDRKWIAEQQVVLGVNFLVPHLLLYTMAGERKRDYPCNMWYQQPWWPLNAIVDDYLSRLCTLMQQGRMVPELLVLHPQESLYPVRRPPLPEQSAWDVYHRDDRERIAPLDDDFQELSHALLGMQRSFDYGDETILADLGRVDASGARPLLRVGEMTYPLVLLPDMTSLRETTLTLLEEFARAGGPVLATGALPAMVDGRRDLAPRLRAFLEQSVPVAPRDALEQELASLAPPLVRVEASGPRRWLWQHIRRVGEAHVVLLVNLSRTDAIAGTLHLERLSGPVTRLDLAAVTAATLVDSGGPVPPLPLYLDPGESAVLIAGPCQLDPFAVARPEDGARETLQVLDRWEIARLDENSLTLDLARVRRGDGPFGAPVCVIDVQRALNEEAYDGPLTLRYDFTSNLDAQAPDAIRLVLEHPERCAIAVNGTPVAYEGVPYWRDIRWLPIAIGSLVRRGENTIDLVYSDFRYGDANSVSDQARRYGTEIESIYLVGDFAVSARPADDLVTVAPSDPTPPWALEAVQGPFTIGAPGPLGPGDLVLQGLPFYAGRVACRATVALPALSGGPVWLEVDRLSVPVVGVRVNGQDAGALAWRPYRLEITGAVRAGENTIELVLYHSLRNLLGPHHNDKGEPQSIGPASFRGTGVDWAGRRLRQYAADWRQSYAVMEFGLLGEVRLVGAARP